jgi:multidrug resistance efflux pump
METKMGKSKKIFIFVVLIIVLIAVFSVIRKKRELTSFEKPKSYPLVVNKSNVKQGELESYQKFLGEFRPENDAFVSSKFNATVFYVANEGTKVKKGDLVFKLDSSDIESNILALTYSQKAILDQIDSAKAQVEASNTQYINAKKEYERYKELYEKELISKEQLENMENLLLCPIIENHRIVYFFLHTFYCFSLINYTLC